MDYLNFRVELRYINEYCNKNEDMVQMLNINNITSK